MFASMLAVLAFMWAAWVVMRATRAVIRSDADLGELTFAGLRASAFIAIALWIVS